MTATLPKATTEAVGIEQRADTLLHRLDTLLHRLDDAGRKASILTERPISHEEAREIADRLINSHFHREPSARVGIPARPDYDDDLLILAYIEQQRNLAKALERARDELSNRIDQRLDRADLDDLSQIRAIVDLYFEDWGSTKADRWKALTGEPLGGGEAAMRIIQRILR